MCLQTEYLVLTKTQLSCFSYNKHESMRHIEHDVKDQLQRFYNLMSYERAFKMLKNDMCITEIGHAVLEL